VQVARKIEVQPRKPALNQYDLPERRSNRR
jgi:hypothetical protein